MKAGRALIGIFQMMLIKNLRGGGYQLDFKKLDSFTLETSKNHLIRNFLRIRRVRVNKVFHNINLSLCEKINGFKNYMIIT